MKITTYESKTHRLNSLTHELDARKSASCKLAFIDDRFPKIQRLLLAVCLCYYKSCLLPTFSKFGVQAKQISEYVFQLIFNLLREVRWH